MFVHINHLFKSIDFCSSLLLLLRTFSITYIAVGKCLKWICLLAGVLWIVIVLRLRIMHIIFILINGFVANFFHLRWKKKWYENLCRCGSALLQKNEIEEKKKPMAKLHHVISHRHKKKFTRLANAIYFFFRSLPKLMDFLFAQSVCVCWMRRCYLKHSIIISSSFVHVAGEDALQILAFRKNVYFVCERALDRK